MSTSARTSYDEVPYASYPFPQSHPDRLATVATLFGLQPPAVEHCRVLELGCASGGNLIPMAEALPESRFLGIDLSERMIADGCRTIATLGLTNIELRPINLTDIGPGFGEFDYIICHGVYSWVSPAVQEHILTVCCQNLAADGVAYVSYKTLPGWRIMGAFRDMMLLHCRQATTPSQRIEQTRALLDFLSKSVATDKSPFAALLRAEIERLKTKSDDYLLHEHLEEHNEPCYFIDFIERAIAKGLRYLGEADLRVMAANRFPPETVAALEALSANLPKEQYLDFLSNRTFRRTLLCHQDREPYHKLRPEQLSGLWVASPARPAAPACDVASSAAEKFQGLKGAEMEARHPLVKAAIMVVAEAWPQAVPFAELPALARSRLDGQPSQDAATLTADTQQLGQLILQGYTTLSTNFIELSVRPPRAAKQAGERPRASPLARLQARVGRETTNLRHEVVTLGVFEQQVVPHLDGQHDRAALVGILSDLVSRGQLTVHKNGQVVNEPSQVQALLGQTLERQLAQLVRHSLLLD